VGEEVAIVEFTAVDFVDLLCLEHNPPFSLLVEAVLHAALLLVSENSKAVLLVLPVAAVAAPGVPVVGTVSLLLVFEVLPLEDSAVCPKVDA